MILPGATLGVLGGGQLGRMFAVAARTMGYEVVVLDPDPDSPAAQFATEHLCAGYDDEAALARLGARCAAVTVEFENVPAETLEYLERHCVVRPSARALAICQVRIDEKAFLRDAGVPTARHAPVFGREDLGPALAAVGVPALLKVSRHGYDGKGQATVAEAAGIAGAFEALGGGHCVLEERIDLATEVSVVLARGADGAVAPFPVGENTHYGGILDTTVVPADISPALARQAAETACSIAERLDYVGVLGVEFFVARDGRLLVNELAPRPHNSGHYTMEACACSQFEQQVRTLCGLPLGDPKLLSPAAMVNLLGDLWSGGAPAWDAVLSEPGAHLHLYGKGEARPGRKMGHVTCLAGQASRARDAARRITQVLAGRA